MPAAIAIRADGISEGLQPAHTAVQFIPGDSLNERIRCSCLSASFSLPVPPVLQPMQSHNDSGFSYAAVLHSYAQLSWPRSYMLLPRTVLPAHGFYFCGSGCSLILQRLGEMLPVVLDKNENRVLRKHWLSFPLSIFAPQ